jgi:hypothetical protein
LISKLVATPAAGTYRFCFVSEKLLVVNIGISEKLRSLKDPRAELPALYSAQLVRSLRAHLPQVYSEITSAFPMLPAAEAIWRWSHGQPTPCHCGQEPAFWSLPKGYRTYCSIRCSTQAQQRKERYTATSVAVWGTTHPAKNAAWREAATSTRLARYGVASATEIPAVKAARQTYLADATRKAEVRAKIAKTNLDRFGAVTPLVLPTVVETTRHAHVEQWSTRFFQNKVAKLATVGITTLDVPAYQTSLCAWSCACGHSWRSTAGEQIRCAVCKTKSLPERQLCTSLLGVGVTEVVVGDRSKLLGLEIDLLVGDQLGIEVNGTYWHRVGGPCTSLATKTRLAKQAGLALLHFWDFEVVERPALVTSLVLRHLARLPTVSGPVTCVPVDSVKGNAFMNEHALTRALTSQRYLGLCTQAGELVAVLAWAVHRGSARFELVEHQGVAVPNALAQLLPALRLASGLDTLLWLTDRRYATTRHLVEAAQLAPTQPRQLFVRGQVRRATGEGLDGSWHRVRDCGLDRWAVAK